VVTRREVLKAAAASISLDSLRYFRSVPPAPPRNFVWMRPSVSRSLDDWKRDFDLLKASGITGIIPEIYNGRQTLFRSKRLPVRAEWLESAIPLAASAGLEVHAWMWCMPCLLDDVIRQHPDWYNVNEVREFVRDTVRELAAIPGLTGIHLDYIRHPDAILPKDLWAKYGIVQDRVYPAYDYGYTGFSRKIFKAKYGVDPIELKDPESSREWLQYRLESVADLVNNYLVPAAKSGGKKISAAVFPGPSLARTMVRQDWGRFQLDAYFPMLYHSFYQEGPEWVGKYTAEAVRTVTAPVHSGMFVSPMSDPELARTVEQALSNGAAGVSVFDFGAMTPARWQLFAKVVGAR
jgi:uncharacterized lipoprotein YddW (UPF0748 family)